MCLRFRRIAFQKLSSIFMKFERNFKISGNYVKGEHTASFSDLFCAALCSISVVSLICDRIFLLLCCVVLCVG